MGQVTAVLRDGMVARIRARHFEWVGDEPLSAGGTDTGPNPYELLLGGLAACITITLKLYANFKGIELHEIEVELTFDRIHADDCEDCDEKAEGRIERIQSRVTVRGDFDDAQRARLTQVAQRCPVHKTLAQGVHFADSIIFA